MAKKTYIDYSICLRQDVTGASLEESASPTSIAEQHADHWQAE
jgi:hypothetical protein